MIRLGEELHYEIDRCKDILHHRELAMAKAAAPHLEESVQVEKKAHKEQNKEQGGQFDAKQTKIISLKEQLNDRDTKLTEQGKELQAEKEDNSFLRKQVGTLKKQFTTVTLENNALREQVNAQGAEIKKLSELINQVLSQQTMVNPTQEKTPRAGPSIFRR